MEVATISKFVVYPVVTFTHLHDTGIACLLSYQIRSYQTRGVFRGKFGLGYFSGVPAHHIYDDVGIS